MFVTCDNMNIEYQFIYIIIFSDAIEAKALGFWHHSIM